MLVDNSNLKCTIESMAILHASTLFGITLDPLLSQRFKAVTEMLIRQREEIFCVPEDIQEAFSIQQDATVHKKYFRSFGIAKKCCDSHLLTQHTSGTPFAPKTSQNKSSSSKQTPLRANHFLPIMKRRNI